MPGTFGAKTRFALLPGMTSYLAALAALLTIPFHCSNNKHESAFSRHEVSEGCKVVPPMKRAQGMPDASAAPAASRAK
jgi:hypothetical protein